MKIAIHYTNEELKEMDISAHMLREAIIEKLNDGQLELPGFDVLMIEVGGHD